MDRPLQGWNHHRSHVLVVLSGPKPKKELAFFDWYRGSYMQEVGNIGGVLSARHYKQHEVDITKGNFQRPPFSYMGLYEIIIDGAEEAEAIIERITSLHDAEVASHLPATWLYYPISEKVGRQTSTCASMVTVAFANALPEAEDEFREWYVTRHIRHALSITAFISGQCFECTQYQRPGAVSASFSTMAIYQQEGTPEEILQGFASIPRGTLAFPTLDHARFAESVYCLL